MRLTELENYISSKQICFVTHSIIIEEWAKHKREFSEGKTQKLLGYKKQNKHSPTETTATLPALQFIQTNHIKVQVDKIDQLLEKALALQTPEVISNEFAERYRQKLAPFHSKKDSQNDWEIIGTFCNYCIVHGIEELSFISANKGEFASTDDLTSIHPHYKDRFPKVNIHYYQDYTIFFEKMKTLSGLSKELIRYTIIPNAKFSYQATIKKNVLDSLCHIYRDMYQEIEFVPLHILRKCHPFAMSERSDASYDAFTMSYVSEAMVEFFNNISTKNGKIHISDESLVQGIQNYQDKIEYILRKLTYNLIFHITGKKSHKRACTHFFKTSKCECVRCCFNRFEFNTVFRQINTEQQDWKEKLKGAFIQYKIGNYHSANKIYEDIVNTALDADQFVTYFIAKYNQRHLANFLENFLANESIDYELVAKLKKIDPIEEAVKLKDKTDYNLVVFIAQDDFFGSAFQVIAEVTRKIVNHYHSQLYGGWNSNQYIEELAEAFATLEAFLNLNFIIYDGYSNFEKLFENVSEGLFASHAISKRQESRLKEFDDYWIHKLIVYGKRETILKLSNRYRLKELIYTPSSGEGDSFLDLFENLVTSKRILKNELTTLADKDNLFFGNEMERLFENIFTIGALLSMDKSMTKRFSNIVFRYLKENSDIRFPVYTSLKFYLEQRGKLLPVQLKLYLLKQCIELTAECHYDFLNTILQSFTEAQSKRIPEKIIEQLLNQCSVICLKCNRKHDFSPLILFSGNLTESQKATLSEQINKSLQEDFRFHLYYLASIYGCIKLDVKKLNLLITKFTPATKNTTIRSIFSGTTDFQNQYVDELINLCFKYNIDTTGKKFNKISRIHPYYKWILDMEGFNYKYFDPEWVLLYGTVYYTQVMAKSGKLKTVLRQYLKEKLHPGIERVLLKITNFVEV